MSALFSPFRLGAVDGQLEGARAVEDDAGFGSTDALVHPRRRHRLDTDREPLHRAALLVDRQQRRQAVAVRDRCLQLLDVGQVAIGGRGLLILGLILFLITTVVLAISKLLLLRLAKNEGTSR